jgi:uridylate kinase
MKVVISLGGSMLFKNNEIDTEYVKKFTEMIKKFSGSLALSVGGGSMAKEYVEKAKKLGANNFEADEIAIEIVKANAKFIASILPNAVYCNNFNEANIMFNDGKIVFLGMATPGQTSDTTSVLFAEQMEADRWVNITNVDGIYDKNPKRYKSAKKFDTITHRELLDIAEIQDDRKPRENFVIDVLATKILARSNIEGHVIDGSNLDDVKNAINGKVHDGTVIRG